MIRRIVFLVLTTTFWCATTIFSADPRHPRPQDTQPGEQHGEVKPPPPAVDEKHLADNLSVTDGQINIDGAALKYKATAGTLVMKDESGHPKASFFFVAYEKQPPADNPARRPITFLFNGGPGAAAVWLHLGAVGPKRVALDDNGHAPSPPYQLEDNPYTWLSATDLVFIDPVGTGYSRAAPGEKPEQFYGVKEDIQSVGEFIRMYTTRYERWLSPKFLAGESYGTTRAAGLSEYLLDNGISLNGIVLISSVLNFGTIDLGHGNELPYALYLPSYTAIAWYHKKLPSDLQSADLSKTLKEVERWAMTDYLVDLGAGTSLAAAERSAAVKKLARYTGLPEKYVDKADLRIDPGAFRHELLAAENKIIGRFDARLAGTDSDPLSRDADYDASLNPFLAAYSATFNDYVRRTLKFNSDLPYEVLSGKVGPWNFGRGGGGYLDVANDLRMALLKNSSTRVLFCSGRFDLATPYLAATYTINHLDVGPQRSNVRQAFFDAGHMLYHHKPDLEKLNKEVTAFIQGAVPNATFSPGAHAGSSSSTATNQSE